MIQPVINFIGNTHLGSICRKPTQTALAPGNLWGKKKKQTAHFSIAYKAWFHQNNTGLVSCFPSSERVDWNILPVVGVGTQWKLPWEFGCTVQASFCFPMAGLQGLGWGGAVFPCLFPDSLRLAASLLSLFCCVYHCLFIRSLQRQLLGPLRVLAFL